MHIDSSKIRINQPGRAARLMARTLTTSATEVLAGLVDRVTFHNSDNGFCVLRVKARGQRDLITLVGHAAMISAGEFVQASGPGSTTAPTASNSKPHSSRLRRQRQSTDIAVSLPRNWSRLRSSCWKFQRS
jgi:hypothetical protein